MGRYALIGGLVACAVGAPVACGTNGSDAAKGSLATQSPSRALAHGAVRIERNAHPMARPELDLGPVDPSTRMSQLSIAFKLTDAQKRDLEQLKQDLQNPGSPSYHKWLTPEDYAARFGAKPEDIARVRKWLGDQGLEVHATSRLNGRVTFAGTAAKIGAAFQTEYRRYKIGSETHFAMAQAPAIPAEFADLVLGIHNTHDLHKRPLSVLNARPLPDSTCPAKSYCSGNGIAPPDWASIYDVTKLYTTGIGGKPIDGTGVTIAIVGVAQIAQSDIDAFHARFAVDGTTPAPLVMTLVPDSGDAQSGSGGTGLEAVLDTEWSSGLAPKATVNYVYVGNDPNSYVDGATFWAIENNLASIISESWGGCEGSGPASDSDLEQVYGGAASVMGITYLAASGDDGAAGCERNGTSGIYVGVPAAFPEVTAVGGTEFPSGSLTYSPVATGYSALEETWNEGDNPATKLGEGAGGVSTIFSRPAYQAGIPACTPVGSFPVAIDPTKMRQVPDVSFAAAGSSNGIIIECTYDKTAGDCSGSGGTAIGLSIGGTSASTPAFAGIVALISQATNSRLGNINPMLYALNASTPTAFHDITAGNNEVKCTPGTDTGCPAGGLYGYAATTGYDCATGLGSLDVANLITAWSALLPTATTITPTPTSTTAGTPVSLQASISVTGSTTSSPALTGAVTFLFRTYDLNGNSDETWELGTVPITGGSATGGSANLSTVVPAGMARPSPYVDVVADYGGDAHHLASQSTLARITLGPLDGFCISPNVASTSRGGTLSFAEFGGRAPVRWEIYGDTTYNPNTGVNGSKIDRDTGAFTGGTYQAGYTLVAAIDSAGVEAYAEVTIDTPTDPTTAPWYGDAGFVSTVCPSTDDAGVVDSGPTDAGAPTDAGPTDAGVVDSGPTDAGAPTDAGPTDTGAPTDAGPTDAGAPTDAGTIDASMPTDSGAPTDAGPTDAGAPTIDSAVPTDAGEHDAGASTSSSSSGCSCTTTGHDSKSTAPALGGLALALVVARRRRTSKR